MIAPIVRTTALRTPLSPADALARLESAFAAAGAVAQESAVPGGRRYRFGSRSGYMWLGGWTRRARQQMPIVVDVAAHDDGSATEMRIVLQSSEAQTALVRIPGSVGWFEERFA